MGGGSASGRMEDDSEDEFGRGSIDLVAGLGGITLYGHMVRGTR